MTAAAWTVPATVVRVIDADTLVATADLGWQVQMVIGIRVADVDAYELSTDAGRLGRALVRDLLPAGAAITVVSHRLLGSREKYGRCLASVTLPDGRDLGGLLLERGLAVAYGGGARLS